MRNGLQRYMRAMTGRMGRTRPGMLALALLTVVSASAYDLCVANAQGLNIYYNLTERGEAEVTYAKRFQPTPDYAGTISIPQTIDADGRRYTVTAVGDHAFFNCRGLSEVRLPATIESVGMMAFAWSDALTQVELPAMVERIGANAFEGCYALTQITASGNFAATSSALYSSDMLSLLVHPAGIVGECEVPNGVEHIGDNAFSACTWLTGVKLPDGLRSIGDNAFYFCNSLQKIEIPQSVDHIGRNALNGCLNLERIEVAAGNSRYTAVDGTLFDGKILLQSPGGHTGGAVIPKGTTEVAEMACYRNYALTTVQMPEGLRRVGQCAFIDCERLTTVELPSTLEQIDAMAFAMCPSLKGVYLRAIEPTAVHLGDEVFANSAVGEATLYVPAESCNLYRHDPEWRQFGAIMPIEGLKEQSITWPLDTEDIDVGSRIPLCATSTSGLSVEYIVSPSSADRVRRDGDALVVTDTGEITITAYQNGDSEYLPAKPLRVSITPVSGIDDEISDIGKVRVYGGIGRIIILGADEDAVAHVYDISGRSLYHGTERDIAVPSGRIYVVNVSGRGYKVSVR